MGLGYIMIYPIGITYPNLSYLNIWLWYGIGMWYGIVYWDNDMIPIMIWFQYDCDMGLGCDIIGIIWEIWSVMGYIPLINSESLGYVLWNHSGITVEYRLIWLDIGYIYIITSGWCHKRSGITYIYISGWWFQTFVLFSISYMGCHPSHWRTHIFQDGFSTTNQI
jgi:hypothetical protein